jgi:DNA polymerase-3 subunit gamma/tau
MAKRATSPEKEPVQQEAYTVLARRYRPQQFGDLIGQEPVAQALINALKSNRVAHAYLFTGARGVGKTSCARILAKALNCVNGPTPTPCGECDMCQGIASGDDIDVLEIDGASNRGIDEVRSLREGIGSRPARARYKVYIIDEVHMLTTPAFNALLKTLEEPPPHVKFIFATTEVQKIPVTILSRCQRFDFAGIGTPRIVERLRRVVADEKREADDEALEIVARRAGGSMRDAQSLLDQLLAFGNERLAAEQVHSLLGTANDDRVVELAAALLERDPKRALELFTAFADEGVQLGELMDQLIAYWRDLMVLQAAGEQAKDLSLPNRHRPTLAKQAGAVSLDTILAGLDVLSSAKARMRTSAHGRTLVEMALVRLARLDDLVSITQLAQLFSGESGAFAPRVPNQSAPPAPRLAPRLAERADHAPDAVKKKSLTDPAESPLTAPALELTESNLAQVWEEIVRQGGLALGSVLRNCELPAISAPNTLVLRASTGYNALRENVARIEEMMRKVVGAAWRVQVEAWQNPPSKAPQAHTTSATAPPLPSSQRQWADLVAREPLLQRAVEVLGAQRVQCDPEFAVAPSSPADAGPEEESASPDR